MAKVVNTFVKGKLNKDLDARLIPNGEYRDARNVQVSKSEGPDVGELENVLGNKEVLNFRVDLAPGVFNLKCIGKIVSEDKESMFLFITNYTDLNPSNLSYSATANNYIVKYDIRNITTPVSTILVQGAFLNFSTTHPIYGINILDNLLYWTDNRNQPRVINLEKAESEGINYYTKEDQISVAKYNPWEPIQVYKQSVLSTGSYETTMKDVTSKFLTGGGSAKADGSFAGNAGFNTIKNLENVNPELGQVFGYIDASGNLITTSSVVAAGTTGTTLNLSPALGSALSDNTELIFNPNPYYDKNFAGDPAYLEDKFVRFSYRFRYEDNQYSLIAPFTQIAFIPKQDGYFVYIKQGSPRVDKDDQASAFKSTVVEFFENKIDEIKLLINLPFAGQDIQQELKLKEMEILYKESDSTVVRVIDTIPLSDIEAIRDSYIFEYNYLSKKPTKTLPSGDLTRVSDKTPVRAFAQEISGNRVIYGNYQTKHTPPEFIDYNVAASEKNEFDLVQGFCEANGAQTIPSTGGNLNITNWAPQNPAVSPNILIGSEIYNTAGNLVAIITSVNVGNTVIGVDRGLTVFNLEDLYIRPIGKDTQKTSLIEYPNHTLKQNRNYQVGVVLSDRYGRQSSVVLSSNSSLSIIGQQSFIGDTIYNEYIDESVQPSLWKGDSLKVLFNSIIGPNNPNYSTFEPGIYNGDSTSASYNPLGWYSYKIVVKQTEQEYYNVYLPGIMASYPSDVNLEISRTSHVVLINDNINKVPRDLTEVGPDQKQYRSSVQLFGRVEPKIFSPTTGAGIYGLPKLLKYGQGNIQYYPKRLADTVSTISTMNDLFDYDPLNPPQPNYFFQFYLYNSNPLIARISTEKQIGMTANGFYNIPTSSGTVETDGDYSIGDAIPIVSYTSAISANSVVSGENIPESAYVSSSTFVAAVAPAPARYDIVISSNTGTPTQIPLTLKKGQVLQFREGFTGANLGAPFNPTIQYLSVYETTPFLSNLDIFWESTSAGLISDLNNLILNSTEGVAGISSFNTSAWNEGLLQPTLPGTPRYILNANFYPIDNFGNQIVDANISDISLDVVDSNTPPNDRNNYFQLFGATGNAYGLPVDPSIPAGQFNISTTLDYWNNVFYFYQSNQNDRLFTFNITITTNVSGIQTTTVQEAGKGPDNVSPSITSNTPATLSLETNRYNTSTLATTVGNNGAANNALKVGDLEVFIESIVSTQEGNINSANFSDYFNLFTTSAAPNLTANLKFSTTNLIPVADYDVKITYEDALAQASSVFNINLDRTSSVDSIETGVFQCVDEYITVYQDLIRIKVSGSSVTAENGYYLYAAVPQIPSILDAISGGTTTITIDRTNAADPAVSCASNGSWYFGVTNFNTLINSFLSNDCDAYGNDCNSGTENIGAWTNITSTTLQAPSGTGIYNVEII